jgi:hypothetical protein
MSKSNKGTNIADRVRERLGSVADGAILGILVWWGQFLAKITPADLRALCEAEGLDPEYLPAVPTPEKAFRRAAKAAQGLAGQEDEEDAVRVELVSRTPGVELTYGVLVPVRDREAKRKAWKQVARVTWLPADGKVITDHPELAIVQKIVDLIPVMLTNYITPDLHRFVNAVMRRSGAVPMVAAVMADGERRGVKINSRFVPAGSADEVAALGRVLRRVPGAGMEAIVVPDDEMSRGTIARAAEHELGGQVAEAEKELESFKTRLAEGGLVRGATLLDRCEQLAALGERTEGLAEKLRFKADEILQRIEAAREGLAALL